MALETALRAGARMAAGAAPLLVALEVCGQGKGNDDPRASSGAVRGP